MIRRLALITLSATLLAACSSAPYTYRADAFNRQSENFGKSSGEIGEVTVCFSPYGATQKQVVDLAKAECAAVSKVAHFKEQGLGKCPMFNPVSVTFTCVDK